MIVDSGFTELREILKGLASTVPVSQEALDREYERTLREFRTVTAFAQSAGLGELAREMMPARQAIRGVDIHLSLAAGQTRSHSFEIGFRILNAGFHKSFQATYKVQHSLQIHVTAADFPPGTDLDKAADSPPER